MEAVTADTPPTVISIAAGEAHTLALTGDGRVFSWGRGMFGRLGTGSDKDELSPAEVRFGISQGTQAHRKLVGVSAGAYHSLALADDGSVWSWGYNIDGQLGFDGENTSTPCLLKEFITDESASKSESPLKIRNVEAGGMMSTAIDDQGTLWIWGNYPHQSTDDPETGFCFERSFVPKPIRDFMGRPVAKVACGSEHIVALVAGDCRTSVYSWGNNRHGQLGLGHAENRARPEIVDVGPAGEAVREVACGGFHTALLAGSGCWTFGLGENGQLGQGTTRSSASPGQVVGLPGPPARLVSVGCGLFHTSVASSSGGVWSWGMERGLGLCPDARVGAESGDATAPLVIFTHSDDEPGRGRGRVQVACGAAHTVLVAQDGTKLWSWGRGRSGVLGTGKADDRLSPTPVSWPGTVNLDEEVKVNDAVEEKSQRSDAEDRERRAAAVERYAGVLHRSIFGRPFDERDIEGLVSGSGDFEVAKEWERMLENGSRGELVGLEMFYRSMLSGVEDHLMKRRIKEAVRECLSSLAIRN